MGSAFFYAYFAVLAHYMPMQDFHIIIITRNRPKSSYDLIKSIQKELSGRKYTISVFDNYSDLNTVPVQDGRISYHKTDRHLSTEDEYWWLLSFALKNAPKAERYYVLPDNIILLKGFFKKSLSQWKSRDGLLRLSIDDTLFAMFDNSFLAIANSPSNTSVKELVKKYITIEVNPFFKRRHKTGVVDVVMLSYTKSRDIYDMTTKAISTLRSSQPQMTFNVFLVETNKNLLKEYPSGYDAKVIIPKEDFNFNKYINIGLEKCKSDLIIMVNNDVVFEQSWLSCILDAMHEYDIDSASPYWKEWFQQRDISIPSDVWIGSKVGEQVFGYCIVAKKKVIKKIKRFDEQFEFWFQDNDYAMQLDRYGFKHGLIRKSIVNHLGAVSHDLIESHSAYRMKEGMRDVFNKKYNSKPYLSMMMKDVKASAIITNWNESHVSVESAKRLLKEGIEVIVVDNGSDDNSDKLFRAFGDSIRYIRLNNNYGSSIARNIAVCYASNDRTFLIDGDILYVPNTIRKYSAVMDMFPDAGIVGYYDYDRSQRNSGHWSGTLNKEEADKAIGTITKINCWYPMAWTQYGLFKTSMLKEVKFPVTPPFNGFGWGYEDDWFFYAMRAKGYKSYSVNAPNYYHDKNFGRRELKKRGLKDMYSERRKTFCDRWGLSVEGYEISVGWIEKKYIDVNI